MGTDYSRLAKDLTPYLAPVIRQALNAALSAYAISASGGGGGGGGGGVPTGGGLPAVHKLADTSGVGPQHIVNGLTAGQVLRATGPSTATFSTLLHSQVGGIGADDHHARDHVLATNAGLGATHTISGATAGMVLRASGATAAAFAQLQHTDLGNVLPDQHHAKLHDVTDATHHGIGGAPWDVLGNWGDVAALLTPSADVSAGASALLRSNAGAVGLKSITSVGNLDLSAATGLIRIQANARIQSNNYASQLTGWGIDYAGGGDFRYIFVDEMHAKSFIADLEQALAGGQIIGKSVAVLHQTFTAPAAGGTTFLYVRDLPSAPAMQVFQNYDVVRLRLFSRAAGSLTITNCWGVVRSDIVGAEYQWTEISNGNGYQRWHFTRSSAPNAGAMATGATVAPESLIFDYGTAGNGYYEVNAIDGVYALNSPYAQIVTWTGHPATGQTVRTRTGNLRGLFAINNEYGFYAGNGVTDADAYIRLSSYINRFNNVPIYMFNGALSTGIWQNNGTLILSYTNTAVDAERDFLFNAGNGQLRIGRTGTGVPNLFWSGTALHIRQNVTPVITLDSDGTSFFAGPMGLGSAGGIYQGTGTFAAPTTGLKLWNDTGIGRLTGYSNGVVQAGFDSSGRIVGGAGVARMDSAGINVTAVTGANYSSYGGYTIESAFTSGSVVASFNYRTNSGTVTARVGLSDGNSSNPEVAFLTSSAANWAALLTGSAGVYVRHLSGYSPTVDVYGVTTFNDSVSVTGTITASGAITAGSSFRATADLLQLTRNGSTTITLSDNPAGSSYLNLGKDRTADGATSIDFYADTVAGYDARWIRNGGVNGTMELWQTGTGLFRIGTLNAAALELWTSSVKRVEVAAAGEVGLGGAATSGYAAHVRGLLKTGDAYAAKYTPTATWTLAANAVFSFAQSFAMILILNITQGTMALFGLRGTAAPSQLSNDITGFSLTQGTASKLNLYYSAGNARYELENKYAATQTIAIHLFYAN